MFFCDFFPSKQLEKFIYTDFTKDIIILPLNILNDVLFFRKHPYVQKIVLDLNLIPTYLPKKIGNKKNSPFFNKFKPDLETYKYPRYMICNRKIYPNITFNIANAFYRNLKFLNNDKYFIQNRNNFLYPTNMAEEYTVPLHIGASFLYKKLGLITTESSEYCKLYAGKDQCTKENIIRARLLTEP